MDKFGRLAPKKAKERKFKEFNIHNKDYDRLEFFSQ
jgi:hypothetical protein